MLVGSAASSPATGADELIPFDSFVIFWFGNKAA